MGTRWAAAQVPPLWRAGVPLWAGRGAAVRAREKGEGSLWGPPPHEGRSEECGGWRVCSREHKTLPSGAPGALTRPGETPGALSQGAVPGAGARVALALQFPRWPAEGAWDRGGLLRPS